MSETHKAPQIFHFEVHITRKTEPKLSPNLGYPHLFTAEALIMCARVFIRIICSSHQLSSYIAPKIISPRPETYSSKRVKLLQLNPIFGWEICVTQSHLRVSTHSTFHRVVHESNPKSKLQHSPQATTSCEGIRPGLWFQAKIFTIGITEAI